MAELNIKLDANALVGAWSKRVLFIRRNVARAATSSMKQVGKEIERDAIAEIARAGFSERWQDTMHVDVHPEEGESVNAAAFIYHKISYAGVFDKGSLIQGKPFLWVPVWQNLPPQILTYSNGFKSRAKRWHRTTPRLFHRHIAPLRSVRGANGPMLVASLGKVRGKRGGMIAAPAVPVFIGIRSAQMPKRFSILSIVEKARPRLAAVYSRNLKAMN